VKYLDELNDQQREAVMHTSGPLMILAGAGAGKTKAITHRIAHLIATGVAADAIVAVTFTNKAALEMRERVDALLASSSLYNAPLSLKADVTHTKRRGTQRGRMPYIATFHALCVRILRENAAILGIPRSFSIWDRADSIRAIKSALKERGLEQGYEAKHVLGRISREKSDGVQVHHFAEHANTPWEKTVREVWHAYGEILKREHALDFDDLLVRAHILLKENADIRAHYRARWSHLLVDEYQDTNRIQFELVRLLAGEAQNVCVVGDIDQNIYSWRGASIEHLLSFEKTFAGAKVVLLEQNYRSTRTILAAANEVIAKNANRYDKTLTTDGETGEPIVLYSALSENDEASFVAEASAEQIRAGTPINEIAVLYRANFQSRALEEAFLLSGIPYRVLGTRFFERREVKDVLSYLRAALNPQSRGDIARCTSMPPRGIGKQTLTRMLEGEEDKLTPAAQKKVDAFRELLARINTKAQTSPVSDVLRVIIRESSLEAHLRKGSEEDLERLENIRELVTLAIKYDTLGAPESSEKLLEEAALMSEQDSLDSKEGAVSLMTVHASKGLEFDSVFITGLEDGLFPHSRHDENADEEEERRLFYVALTRARKRVFLTHAQTRMMYGTRTLTTPSEFLNDISPELLAYHDRNTSPYGESIIT